MLAGDTVTLLNRGGDPLVLDANGPFRFAAPVTGAYDVTVGTQPGWQDCGVTPGSGTAAADVQDVVVACQRAGTVSTLASGFTAPSAAALDSAGNLFVTDGRGLPYRLLLVTARGFTAAVATLPGPSAGLAVAADGSVYATILSDHGIVEVGPGGTTTPFAGTGAIGGADGPRATATFSLPYGLAIDAAGNMYVTEYNGHRIRRISTSGTVTTLAGSGAPGHADGTGAAASFDSPTGVAVDRHGNVFVADYGNNRIRKVTPAGVVSTFAGSGAAATVDGEGTAASLHQPFGIAMGSDGYLIVTEAGGHTVRRISPTGWVHTLAGTGAAGGSDGPAANATFNVPAGATVDAAGNLYILDYLGDRVRSIRR